MKFLFKLLIVHIVVLLTINPTRAQEINKVTLQLKWKHQFQFAGYYAAIEKGFYKEVGITVNLIEAVEGQNPTDAVFEGKAQFGICTSDILLTRSQKKDAVVLATIFQHSPQILIASKQSGIDNVQSLIGKKVAFEPNSADIIAYLNDEGVTLDKCIIEQHTFNTDLLIAGQIDAISAYSTDEPFILNAVGFNYTIISPLMGGIDFYGEGLFTTEALIRKDPVLVNNFREASLKGWKYAMDNPEEIIQLIYNKYSQRHSLEHLRHEALHMKKLIMADVVEIGYTNSGRWESISNIYKKLNMLDATFTTKGLLYSDYLEPKINIPWNIIIILLMIFLIISSTTYFFYKSYQQVKKEIRGRKKLEIFLQESEQKYHVLFENSPDAYLIIADGVFIDCNLAAEHMIGCDKSQIIGKSPVYFSPEFQPNGRKSSELANEVIQEAFSSGENTFEWLHRQFDGTNFTVEVSIASMNLGKKPALFAAWRDISQRKLSQEALKESESRFRSLFDKAPLGYQSLDINGHFIDTNLTWLDMFGYDRSEVIGKWFGDFITPQHHEYSKELFTLLKIHGTIHGEFEMVHKNGSILYISFDGRLGTDPNGTFHQAHCILRDITEQKKADRQIQENNEQIEIQNQELQFLNNELNQSNLELTDAKNKAEESHRLSSTLLQTIPFGMDIVDERGNILFLSDNLIQTFGENAHTRKCWEIYRDDKIQCSDCPLHSEIIVGETKIYETYGVMGGRIFDVIHTGMIFKGKKALLEIFMDITERKKNERTIQHQNQELHQLNSDKDRFISILAHDLKNPFNTILGYLELLTENIRKYDINKVERQIKLINHSAQSTYNLLLDILLWARSQSGKIPFEPKELKCDDICKTILTEMQFLADKKRITISHYSEKDVSIYADIDMLKTIIRNLISNAIKFTNHGGSINISAKLEGDSQIISISDDGVGMVSEILNKLFTSTRMGSTKGTDNESGTGLGLSLCKEFVDKHGGKIWAESNPGKGTTFYFTLPIRQ